MKLKSLILFSVLLPLVSAHLVRAAQDPNAPMVPPSLVVPAGHKVAFRAHAAGVQVYVATRSPANPSVLVWTFTKPEAILQDDQGAVIGTHFAFAGPTRPGWASESGSLVVGARTVPPVTVDASALPWLLLEAIDTEGSGIFKRTTYIQRVNTTGGLAPAAPPMQAGQEARVPYTAEYYFYRVAHGGGTPRSAL